MYEFAVRLVPELEHGQGQVYSTIGFVRDNALIAVAVYTNYRGTDIELSLAATDPRWSTRTNWGVIFDYPLNQLGCLRVTSITTKNNKRVRKLMEGVGFVLEGKLRDAFAPRVDAFVYGMTKRDCKWIEPNG